MFRLLFILGLMTVCFASTGQTDPGDEASAASTVGGSALERCPKDLVSQTLSYLDSRDRIAMMISSTSLRRIGGEDLFWKKGCLSLILQEYGTLLESEKTEVQKRLSELPWAMPRSPEDVKTEVSKLVSSGRKNWPWHSFYLLLSDLQSLRVSNDFIEPHGLKSVCRKTCTYAAKKAASSMRVTAFATALPGVLGLVIHPVLGIPFLYSAMVLAEGSNALEDYATASEDQARLVAFKNQALKKFRNKFGEVPRVFAVLRHCAKELLTLPEVDAKAPSESGKELTERCEYSFPFPLNFLGDEGVLTQENEDTGEWEILGSPSRNNHRIF